MNCGPAGKPFWVSWSLEDTEHARLRSGEGLQVSLLLSCKSQVHTPLHTKKCTERSDPDTCTTCVAVTNMVVSSFANCLHCCTTAVVLVLVTKVNDVSALQQAGTFIPCSCPLHVWYTCMHALSIKDTAW